MCMYFGVDNLVPSLTPFLVEAVGVFALPPCLFSKGEGEVFGISRHAVYENHSFRRAVGDGREDRCRWWDL